MASLLTHFRAKEISVVGDQGKCNKHLLDVKKKKKLSFLVHLSYTWFSSLQPLYISVIKWAQCRAAVSEIAFKIIVPDIAKLDLLWKETAFGGSVEFYLTIIQIFFFYMSSVYLSFPKSSACLVAEMLTYLALTPEVVYRYWFFKASDPSQSLMQHNCLPSLVYLDTCKIYIYIIKKKPIYHWRCVAQMFQLVYEDNWKRWFINNLFVFVLLVEMSCHLQSKVHLGIMTGW